MIIKIEDLKKRYPCYRVNVESEACRLLVGEGNAGWFLGYIENGEVDVLEEYLQRYDAYHKEDSKRKKEELCQTGS